MEGARDSGQEENKLLVELFDLNLLPEGGGNWFETARWIKYEEDVEGVDKHWGRPRVAFLDFHSLKQLRECFETGVILLNLPSDDLPDIVNRLTLALIAEYNIDSSNATRITAILSLDRQRRTSTSGTIKLRKTERRPSIPTAGKRSSLTEETTLGPDPKAVSVIEIPEDQSSPRHSQKMPTQPDTILEEEGAGESEGEEHHEAAEQPSNTLSPATAEQDENAGASQQGSANASKNASVSRARANKRTWKKSLERMAQQNQQRLRRQSTTSAGATSDPNERTNEPKVRMVGGSLGRHFGKPLLRRLSTVIGIDAFGGGGAGAAGGTGAAEGEVDEVVAQMMAQGAEVAQIYVGIIQQALNLRFAMVRLAEPSEQIESSLLRVRYIFVIVGPPMSDVNYHELGRAVGTLMADAAFKASASRAENREDLVRAIDNFLDLSIVVPPGNIDSRSLLTVDDVRKALKQRQRAKNVVESKKDKETLATLNGVAALLKREGSKIVTTPEKPEDFMMDEKRERRRDHVKDALKRTGRPFGGVIDDIKYRAPYYWRDFRDACSFPVVTSILFMFFANFASAVAFGEVMGHKTEGYMGVTEILLAHGLCGVVWGLIACQPLCIQAAVGPFLVFEASLFTFCKTQNINFLSVRVWTGFWSLVFTLLTTLVEGSFVVRYLTRFTEDIFTGLIAFIFIWEAFRFLYREFSMHPLVENYCGSNATEQLYNVTNGTTTVTPVIIQATTLNFTTGEPEIITSAYVTKTDQPNTALLSLILVVVTFVLTYSLKQLRTSIYFGRTIRKTVSDFGVPIAVALIILLYELVFKSTYIKNLNVPDDFSLTDESIRGWFVHPMGDGKYAMPMWAIWASVVPAFLVGILVFAEVEIIEVLLAKPDRGLKRPHGFHWDLIVCSGLIFVCSLFGLPWMCPAAVQSLSHANSLAVTKRTAPGAAPKIDYVIEQRVTCIIVGALHAAAAFANIALQRIPVPVLFGLFLYLGLMGLLGLQFVHRLVLFFIPQKYFPDQPYCKEVSMWRMHLFTFVQLVCFGILWAVNSWQMTALAFPFVLTLIACFRIFVMPYMFQPSELEAIDGCGYADQEQKTKTPEIDETDQSQLVEAKIFM